MSEAEQITEEIGPAPEAPAPHLAGVDQKLIDKLLALKTLVKLQKLLVNGLFVGEAATDLCLCRDFVEKTHGELIKECEKHPQWEQATNPRKAEDDAAKAKAEAKRARKAERKGFFSKLTGQT